MIRETMEVAVFVERRKLKNPWIDHAWMPVSVVAGVPSAEPWTIVEERPGAVRFYAGPFRLEFFGADTGTYRDNLLSGRPSLWVALRPSNSPPGVALYKVTADSAEGEALTEPGTDIIEALPMPAAVQARLAAFVQAHHVERPFVKRKRDEADPKAMATRPPGRGKPEEDR
ncbi:DUF3305 domain-containing protein [Inquilinus sp. CAU 1745]|uniref:DUF3305 domain-containing protein n=1 Tax=Inquilinus sp. CAU 1745 TaxID=3140369 RepID=UPI00325AD925